MEGLLALLALLVVGWILIGPILVFGLQTRIRELEKRQDELTRMFAAMQTRQILGNQSKTTSLTQTQVMESPTDQTQEVSLDDDEVAAAGPVVIPQSDSEFATLDEGMPAESVAAAVSSSMPPPLPDSKRADSESKQEAYSKYGFPRRDERGPQSKPTAKSVGGMSLEELVGGKWLTWVGAVALIIGLGFFLKYAIELGYLGPTQRVLMGLLASLLMFGGAVFGMRKQYRLLAEGLAGTALGTALMSLYAAFGWYHLVDQNIAFAGMVVAAAATLSFAAYFHAEATAFLGLLGGFLTPFLLSTGRDAQLELFSYILLLDTSVLILATFRRWMSVQTLALVGTILIWIVWFESYYADEKFAITIGLMTAFWAMFLTIPVWQHGVRKMLPHPADILLMLATPTAYFLGLAGAFERTHSGQTGRIAAGLGVAYFLIAWLMHVWKSPARMALLCFAGVGLTFLTIAVPLECSRHWIPLAWSVESLILVEIGLRMRNPQLRKVGFGLLGVVQVILIYYALGTFNDPNQMRRYFDRTALPGTTIESPSWTSVFNGRTFSFLGSAAVMGVLAWEYHRRRKTNLEHGSTDEFDGQFFGPLLAGIPWSILAVLAVETFSQGDMRHWVAPTFIGLFSTWTALAALSLTVLALAFDSLWARRAALATFGILALLTGACLLDTLMNWRSVAREFGTIHSGWWWLPIANPRGLGLVVSITTAFVASLLLRSRAASETTVDAAAGLATDPTDLSKIGVSAILGLFAYAVGLTLVTTETYSQGVLRNWGTGTSLGVTTAWTLFAVAALIAGIAFRNSWLRILALGNFVLATVKVFFYDIWYLNTTIRFIAFAALGIALMLTSYLYRRFRDRIPPTDAPT